MSYDVSKISTWLALYLAQQKVEPVFLKDLALLPELFLDLLLAGPGEVGRALADSAKGEGTALCSDLLGQIGGGLVDGLASVLGASLVAAVGQLVVAGIEGEGLHHVGAGAEELAVELEDCGREVVDLNFVFQCMQNTES
jgi:hypothetical protein